MVKPPTRDPGDSLVAENAEAALFKPEKAKYTRTPERISHMSCFALLEVGFIAMQGDTVKARAAYQDFFTLWKEADPDIPVLKQAKSEYERLK